MNDEGKSRIKMLTRWILKAFSSFAPKWHCLETGAAETGANFCLFLRPLLHNFFQLLKFLLFFLPCLLPAVYYLLLFWGCPEKRLPLVLPKESLVLPGKFLVLPDDFSVLPGKVLVLPG